MRVECGKIRKLFIACNRGRNRDAKRMARSTFKGKEIEHGVGRIDFTFNRGRNNSRSGIFSRRAAEIYTISPKKELKIWIDIYLTRRKKGDIIIKLSHERAKRLREQAREGKT